MQEKLNKSIGKSIERWRQVSGVSQESLAVQAGISRTYLSDIERGLRNISVYTLYKLALGLNMSAATIFLEIEQSLVPTAEQELDAAD